MISSHYYGILKVDPGASLAEVKVAYHKAAKHNHPDLFPEADHQRCEMRMMQINAAYLAIICERSEADPHPHPRPGPVHPRRQEPPRDATTTEVGQLRDPAYTYYKLGFRYFSEGRRTLSKHYLTGAQRIDFSTESIDVLKFAVAALHQFHKAYGCFERVSSDYPNSVWAKDSALKIYYLNRYNAIYQRICDNLGKQISKINAIRARSEAK